MNIPGKYIFDEISKGYTGNPAIRALVALLPLAFQTDTPNAALLTPVADATLVSLFQRHRIHKQKLLHDRLNDGSIILDEDAIENDEFIHAYLQTVQFVDRTRSDQKIERFAQILKSFYQQNLNIDQFEYYSTIFDEITDLEFTLLLIKLEFEDDLQQSSGKPNRDKWTEFVREACQQLKISPEVLNDLVIRLQGTGCFIIRAPVGGPQIIGNTTNLFRELVKLVS